MYSALVCSKNGRDKLQRMLASLALQDCPAAELILLDDGSSPPLPAPAGMPASTRVMTLRNERSSGYIAARNRMARVASRDYLLFLDDDVVLDDPSVIGRAVRWMEADDKVGAVAFLQKTMNGSLMGLQPFQGSKPRPIAKYYGWSHLIRRKAWSEAGPFEELFGYGGEEVEFSLRLLDKGYTVFGDPAIAVIHDAAASHKNRHRRHFTNVRNSLLTLLLRYPRRALPSWLKNGLLTARPLPDSREPHFLFRIRLAAAVAGALPSVAIRRRAVSPEALNTFWRLHDAVDVEEGSR